MRRCPICGAPSSPAVRPFCSKRCADVDLGRWLGGEYRIAPSDDDAGYGRAGHDSADGDAADGDAEAEGPGPGGAGR